MLIRLLRSMNSMSGQNCLSSFEQRTNTASQKLDLLKKCLNQYRENLIANAEKQLQVENETLVSKVASLKKKLCEAELLNDTQSNQDALVEQSKLALCKSDQNHTLKEAANQETGDAVVEKKQKAKTKEKKTAKQPKVQETAPVDVSRLDFRVAQIVNVKRHPDADSLYVEQINTGEESLRTVVTGLVKHVPIEQMENRMVVLMCNLKPAKMRGILSQAMVMCANCPEKVEIIDPPSGSVPGDRIVFDGYPGEPDPMLNPKKKVWEKIQPDLCTNNECVACYKDVPFRVEGKGVCRVQTLVNCGIK